MTREDGLLVSIKWALKVVKLCVPPRPVPLSFYYSLLLFLTGEVYNWGWAGSGLMVEVWKRSEGAQTNKACTNVYRRMGEKRRINKSLPTLCLGPQRALRALSKDKQAPEIKLLVSHSWNMHGVKGLPEYTPNEDGQMYVSRRDPHKIIMQIGDGSRWNFL